MVSLRFPALFVALIGCLSPRAARAEEPPRDEPLEDHRLKARSLTLAGFEELQRGQPARAVPLLAAADALYHAPTIVLLLAQAREQLGQIVEARALYRSILKEDLPRSAPREFFDAKVEAKRSFDALERRFATVQILVPGASEGDVTLTIDGAKLEPFYAVHPQNPGRHTITVRGEDGASVTQVLTLKAGDAERLLVPFAAIDPKARRRFVAPAAAAFGVGLLGVAGGAITAALSMQQSSIIEARSPSAGRSSAITASSTRALDVASLISFAAGGVGLSTSAILLYIGGRGREGAPPAASAGLGALSFTATF